MNCSLILTINFQNLTRLVLSNSSGTISLSSRIYAFNSFFIAATFFSSSMNSTAPAIVRAKLIINPKSSTQFLLVTVEDTKCTLLVFWRLRVNGDTLCSRRSLLSPVYIVCGAIITSSRITRSKL